MNSHNRETKREAQTASLMEKTAVRVQRDTAAGENAQFIKELSVVWKFGF